MHHQQNIVAIVEEALAEAQLTPKDIDAIAFTKVRSLLSFSRSMLTLVALGLCVEMQRPGLSGSATALLVQGPGMGGPLQTCAICARMLSLMWKVPIVAVNHCVGTLFCSASRMHTLIAAGYSAWGVVLS